jgi:hypothetical protein
MFKNIKDPEVVKKFNKIQNEILEIGWIGVLKYYHPDINLKHPRPFDLFSLYKEIFQNMKKRAIIKANNELTVKYNEVQSDILNRGILFFKHGGQTLNGIDNCLYLEIYDTMKEVLMIS